MHHAYAETPSKKKKEPAGRAKHGRFFKKAYHEILIKLHPKDDLMSSIKFKWSLFTKENKVQEASKSSKTCDSQTSITMETISDKIIN